MKKETVSAKHLKLESLCFTSSKKQIDYICYDLTYLKFKNMKNLKTLLITFSLSIFYHVTYAQISTVNGGSFQGPLSIVPDNYAFGYAPKFNYIKPENTYGFWRLRVFPVRISTALQELQVKYEYDIDIPKVVHGVNALGHETIYTIADYGVNITGRLEFKIRGQYINPLNKVIKEFSLTTYTDVLGNSTAKGSLFTWGPDIVDAISELEINKESNPTNAFLSNFKVVITSIEAVGKNYNGYEELDKKIGEKVKKDKIEIDFKGLIQEAQFAESQGNNELALKKYEKAYKLRQDPEIKSKMDALKSQQINSQDQNNSTSNNQSNNNYKSNSTENNDTQAPKIHNNSPSPVYNPKDWGKFNQMQQSVNQWNQDWYKRIEQNEQQRLQKQAMYEQAGEQIGTAIGNLLNEVEQRKQREEIAKAQKRINQAVSTAFLSVKKEADYWSSFANDLLNVANKYSKNLNKTAYDEIESSLESIKRILDEIGEQHNYLQEKLRKDWDYADNDPRKFLVRHWEDYSFKKEPLIFLRETFTIGSRISDKTIRCNFVNDLLPLINKYAERSQSTYHITSIEQAYIASGCKNYSYENLLKSAKAIEAYEKMRNEKTRQIQALKKKVEEELVEIKVLESTAVKVENISNQYQIKGVDLSDLKNDYNLLKGNSGAFENELKKLNPDNLIKAYGGANTGSLVFKPSGIFVAPGNFEVILTREFSSPKEYKVTLNAIKGQKTLTINPEDYNSAFEFEARFKPYNVYFANKYRKKNKFGKTRWLIPELKFYTSGIVEFNLTPISLVESYSPKGFYKGRPVFFHKLDFFVLTVGKGSFINGFITSDNLAHYRLHSNFIYFGSDLARYEPGFTISIFKSSAELRLYGGGAVSFINFRVNEKEDNAAYGSSLIKEDNVTSWNVKYAVYPGVKYLQRIGKTTLQIGYNYNAFVEFDRLSKKNKSNFDEYLYHKYTPFNEIGNFFKHEFSIRFTF